MAETNADTSASIGSSAADGPQDPRNMDCSADALLPCPFCGGRAEILEDDSYRPSLWDVQCNTLGCFMEWGSNLSLFKDEIIAMWNKRAGQ